MSEKECISQGLVSALCVAAGPVLGCVNEDELQPMKEVSSYFAYHDTSQETVVKIGTPPNLRNKDNMFTEEVKMITCTSGIGDEKIADLHASQDGMLGPMLCLTTNPQKVGNLGPQCVMVEFDKEDIKVLTEIDKGKEDIKGLTGNQIPSRWHKDGWHSDSEISGTCCPAKAMSPDQKGFFSAKDGLWLGCLGLAAAGALLGQYAVDWFCAWQEVEETHAHAISKHALLVGLILTGLAAVDCKAVHGELTGAAVVTCVVTGFLRVVFAGIAAYNGVFDVSHLFDRHQGNGDAGALGHQSDCDASAIGRGCRVSYLRAVLALIAAPIVGCVAGLASDATVYAGAALARQAATLHGVFVSRISCALPADVCESQARAGKLSRK